MYAYTVTVTFTGPQQAGLSLDWLEWMRSSHLADVCAAGARQAILVQRDDTPHPTFEARYLFESRGSFDRYLDLHAPRLRREGLEKFPVENGIQYARSTGTVLAQASGDSAAPLE